MKEKIAVFDIDGTVFRSSLLIELVEGLIMRGVFPENAWKLYEREKTKWLDREGHYDDYIYAVIVAFMKHLKGVSYTELAAVGEEVLAHNERRVYRYTRDLIASLKKRDYFLLAVSHSPKMVVEGFAKRIGFDKVYGMMYELGPGDRFTGARMDEHLILNKAAIVKRAIEKESLTLSGSYGVGDTESDIAMLELVAHPIVFNPNEKLYKYAKRMGWNIVVERKDVIHRL